MRVNGQEEIVPGVDGKVETMPEEPKTILICEDEPTAHEVIRHALTELGYNTVSAWSGDEAVSLAESTTPDAILLDMLYPDMDGLTALNGIRSQPANRDTPVVVMTASSAEATRQRLAGVVVHAILTKPVKPEELQRSVESMFRRFQLSDLPQILFVGTSPVYRKIFVPMLNQLLGPGSFEITSCKSVSEALKLVGELNPSLVLLEVGFQPMTAELFLAQDQKKVPVLVLMTKNDPSAVKRLLEKGAQDIVTMPVKLERLARSLRRVLTGKHRGGQSVTRRWRILIVEDFMISARQLERALTGDEYSVIHCKDAESALKFARVEPPDLMFIDLTLPHMSGEELVQNLVASKWQIPFVAMSGASDKHRLQAMKELGALTVFRKPLKQTEIAQFVREFFHGEVSKHATAISETVGPSPEEFKDTVLKEINTLEAVEDPAELRRLIRLLAHNVSGSAGLIQRSDLENLGREIENRADAAELDQLQADIAALKEQISHIT